MSARSLLIAFCAVSTWAPPGHVQTRSADRIVADIERYIAPLAKHGLSGTLLVARGDDVLFERSYGRVKYPNGVRITPATPTSIASITKPLTGILVRRLAAQGTLSLNDTIAKWLPDFPNASRITVAMLLGHRAGLPHRVTQLDDELKPQTAASVVELIKRRGPELEPDVRRQYSSAGYSVLARIIELATGKTYAQALHDLILAPAATTSTMDATQHASQARQIRGNYWTPTRVVAAPPRNLSFLVGAGSVYSTPRDLLRIVQAINTGKYPDAIAGAVTAEGGVQWNGWSSGFRAFLDYNPTTNITVVFIGNMLNGITDWIQRDLPRVAAGEQVAAPAMPVILAHELAPALRASIEGVYDFGFTVAQKLKFASSSMAFLGSEYLLISTSDSTLVAPQDFANLTIKRDSISKAIVGLHYELGTLKFEIPRR